MPSTLEYCVYNYIDWCSITVSIDICIILFRLLYLINLYEMKLWIFSQCWIRSTSEAQASEESVNIFVTVGRLFQWELSFFIFKSGVYFMYQRLNNTIFCIFYEKVKKICYVASKTLYVLNLMWVYAWY